MKVGFVVRTPAHIFAEWLKYQVLGDEWDGRLDFPTEEGRIVLHTTVVSPRTSDRTEISLWATCTVPSDEDAGRRERRPPVIDFLVEPLDPKRTEVTAECRLPAVMDYFKELLSRMAERWEGAPEVVSRPEQETEPRKPPGRPVPPHIKKRREKVLRLSIDGLTILAISQNLGCSESTIKRDRKWLRDQGQL